MVPVSVVIITKNEADTLLRCINAARLLTDDIVIVDNNSTDDTLKIALQNNCRLFQEEWNGYGANKNKGIAHARYNWILSIDADEIMDRQLINNLQQLDYCNPEVVYDIRFKTYFGSKLIRFGSWGRDHHIRLFNRTMVKWAELPVHETLLLPQRMVKKQLGGYIYHYSVKNADEYREKAMHYAFLSAKKYFDAGKKAGYTKRFLSPIFNFLRNYFLYLGFFDGREGWLIAWNTAKHTYLKYQLLYLLHQESLQTVYERKHVSYTYPAERAAVNTPL